MPLPSAQLDHSELPLETPSVSPSELSDGSSLTFLSRLRIVFLAGTLGQGGAERQLFYMLRSLKAAGASLRLLTLTQGEFWEEQVRRLGVPVIWVGRCSSRAARLWLIVREIMRSRPDLVQSAHFYTNLYAAVAGRFLRVPDIGAVRSDVFGEVEATHSRLGRVSLGAPRWIAANSSVGIRNAISRGINPSRCFLLRNVVDTAQFSPAVHQATAITRVLFAGRLSQEKRPDRFLEVLAKVKRSNSIPVQGIVAGDGPLLPALQTRARQLGLLPKHLEFRRAVTDMPAAYHGADMLVLTSDWEGAPNVLLEASASGLPVVATRVGGVPEVVRDGDTGFLCNRDDIHGLASAVSKLVGNTQLRRGMGERGRRFVQENHSTEGLGQSLTDLYEQILQ